MPKNLPPGFDAAAVIAGLHEAMAFGEPTRVGDKATFYLVTEAAQTVARDDDGIPFDIAQRPTRTAKGVQVSCAIEFVDRADQGETFGLVQATRIKVTLLDPDYQKVKGFRYMSVGGDRYNYRLTEPPVALGSIDVWTVHCVAEDES
jgi:hypothetical protein